METTYILNIGSNLGNRRLNLSRAVAAIGNFFAPVEISHVVESEPSGFDSTNAFLNIGVIFSSEFSPQEMLEKLQEIEKAISPAPHRDDAGNYIDRIIDIDIIAAGETVMNTETLTLPHPRLAERRFVLEPLLELAPGWHHPVTGLSPIEMLRLLAEKEQ